MLVLLDTNVAIHVRDGDQLVLSKLAQVADEVAISVITRVELEGGVVRDPDGAAARRLRLDEMYRLIRTLPFDDQAADAYAAIMTEVGYSRRKLLDRMIAAQALVHGAMLITMNARDFADVPGLALLDWSG